MNESWFKHLEQAALAMEPWPDPRFPPSPYYRFLRLLAQNVKPRLSVELGVCGGGASFHLCEGWPQGTVIGIDKAAKSSFEQDNWHFIQARHLDTWVPWRGDSVAEALHIFKLYGAVDILFIDTIHTTERTVEEWEAWEPFMASRAVICLDDLNRAEMDGLWEWVPWHKARLDDLHPGGLDDDGFGDGGFGVAWR